MQIINVGLAAAFPSALRQDALTALDRFPEPEHPHAGTLSFKIAAEIVEIPKRLYHSPDQIVIDGLTADQRELVDCLLTRHANGFVRQEHLERIVRVAHPWVAPFVVQLLGEYVVEIIEVIHQNLDSLDRPVYREFLWANPDFFARTSQRVTSYWDRYYRQHRREEYVGFKVMEFFVELAKGSA